MRTKDFFPSHFFNALEGEMTVKQIAKKVKCSESTALNNLKILIGEGRVVRKLKLGDVVYKKLD